MLSRPICADNTPFARRGSAPNYNRSILEKAFRNFQELTHTILRNKLAATQQQTSCRIDEKISV